MVTGSITIQLQRGPAVPDSPLVTFQDDLCNHAGLFRTIIPSLSDSELEQVTLKSRFESRSSHIESIMSFVEHLLHKTPLIPAEELSGMMLIIHESVSNAVYHGNLKVPEPVRIHKSFPEYEAELESSNPELLAKTVDLTLRITRTQASVIISDSGGGFDYERELNRLAPPEPDRETGRGIFLLKQTVDEITFQDNGETLHLTKIWRHHA